VLPVQHALQGHPESGKLWEKHISKILSSTEFKILSTRHDKSIYRGEVNGRSIYILRQVDDFAMATPSKEIARKVFDVIGLKLQLEGEKEPPFKYLGLIDDFNGVSLNQYSDCIKINCSKYID